MNTASNPEQPARPRESSQGRPRQPVRAWGGVQRRGQMLLLLVVSLVVALFSLVSIGSSDSALQGKTFAPSLVAIIWLVSYLLATYRAFGTPYLFATAYVVCLFVFHFGLLIQDGFGIIQIGGWIGPIGSWAVRAGWYANLAFACFGIGMSLYVLRRRAGKPPPPATVNAIARQNIAWIHDLGIGLLIASVIFLIGAFANYGNLLALTRLELFHFSDTRFISVFSMMIPTSAIALLISARTGRQRLLSYAVAIFVVLFFLLSGQRSSAFFPMMAAAVVWVKMGRRISPVLATAAILGVLLIIPVIGYLRTMGSIADSANTEAIEQASGLADIGAAFREMGGSLGPLLYTIMLIPEEEPYRYGSTYLDYVLASIPNVGLLPKKDTSRAAVIEMLRTQGEKKALLEMNVGDWASYHIIREQFLAGGGAGYSGVAEPYFNFGLVGVLVFFLGIGAFLGRLDCTPLVLYRNWLFFGVLIYWHLLPTVRNGLAVFVKPAMFTLIVIFVWLLIRRLWPAATPRTVRDRKADKPLVQGRPEQRPEV